MPVKAKDGGGKRKNQSSVPLSGVLTSIYALNSSKEYNYVFQVNDTERQIVNKYKDILINDAAHFAEVIYDKLFSNPDIARALYKNEGDGGSNSDLIKGLLNHLYVIVDDNYSQRDMEKEAAFITSLMKAGIKPAWILGCYCSLLDHFKDVIAASNSINKTDKDELLSILIKMIFKCYSMTSDIYWGSVLDELESGSASSDNTNEKLQAFIDTLPQCLWTVETSSDEISYYNTAAVNAFQKVPGLVPGFDLLNTDDQSRVNLALNKARQGEESQLSVSFKGDEYQGSHYRVSFYPRENVKKQIDQVQCLMEPADFEKEAQLDRGLFSTELTSLFKHNTTTTQVDLHTNPYQLNEEQIYRAIETSQFELHYQPNIGANDGRTRSVEALIRWHHPEFGIIQPADFIPIVARSGLMEPVTRWVMSNALGESKKWSNDSLIIPVSVNVSYDLVNSDSLPGLISEVLSETGSTSEHLQIEISDRVIMSDYPSCIDTMSRLNDMGITIAIDDFGTGQLSFNRIEAFPAQILKIDNMFMESLNKHQQDNTLVRSMIDLGHNLGCQIVGEGVENQRIFDSLNTLGCDCMQGFHISKPLSHESMIKWMMSDIRH